MGRGDDDLDLQPAGGAGKTGTGVRMDVPWLYNLISAAGKAAS